MNFLPHQINTHISRPSQHSPSHPLFPPTAKLRATLMTPSSQNLDEQAAAACRTGHRSPLDPMAPNSSDTDFSQLNPPGKATGVCSHFYFYNHIANFHLARTVPQPQHPPHCPFLERHQRGCFRNSEVSLCFCFIFSNAIDYNQPKSNTVPPPKKLTPATEKNKPSSQTETHTFCPQLPPSGSSLFLVAFLFSNKDHGPPMSRARVTYPNRLKSKGSNSIKVLVLEYKGPRE